MTVVAPEIHGESLGLSSKWCREEGSSEEAQEAEFPPSTACEG